MNNKPIINKLLYEIKEKIKSCPYMEDEDWCNMCSPLKNNINKLETQINNMQNQIYKENDCYRKCETSSSHYNIGNGRLKAAWCEKACLDNITWYKRESE